MADIFISYSKADQGDTRLLAAFLEASGYIVWWDTSLLSGDQFRKVIMTELAKARAVIVIWTPNSVQSEWVQSEAGRAHADRKLIPVKMRSLEYKDIPPPFDNQHCENLDNRDAILGAVVAQLAKPIAAAPVWKQARYELFSWFGIVGTSITLASNMNGVMEVSRFLKLVLEHWSEAMLYVWKNVFFFLPKLTLHDAIYLTMATFYAINLISTSRERSSASTATGSRIVFNVIVSVFVTASILLVGTFSMSEVGYYDTVYGGLLRPLEDLIMRNSYGFGFIVFLILLVPLSTVYILPIIIISIFIFLIYALIAGNRLNLSAFSARLWKVVAGFAVLLALNYATLWLEAQPWSAKIIGT